MGKNHPLPYQIKVPNILLFVIQYQNEIEIICAKTIGTLAKETIHFVMLLDEYTQVH